MKPRVFVLCALFGAFAIPVIAQAGSPRDRASGGGQILISARGAGNTIAFTAQNRSGGAADAATGQLQYIDRAGNDKLHGTVSCLRVTGNEAKLAGTGRDGRTFQLYVLDNGQGQAPNDMIMFQLSDSATCDFDTPDDAPELARGNAQVYDAPSNAQRRRRAHAS
jgi:hypothetical protein